MGLQTAYNGQSHLTLNSEDRSVLQAGLEWSSNYPIKLIRTAEGTLLVMAVAKRCEAARMNYGDRCQCIMVRRPKQDEEVKDPE